MKRLTQEQLDIKVAQHQLWVASTFGKGERLILTRYDLSHMTFSNLDLRNSVFDKCDLSHCSFEDSKLDNAVIQESKISNCVFSRSSLTDCKMRGSDFSQSVFYKNYLKGADFSDCILKDARIEDCDLRCTNFKGVADMDTINLRGSEFGRAETVPIANHGFFALRPIYDEAAQNEAIARENRLATKCAIS